MVLALQLSTILGLAAIAYQDIRDRMVSWVLFPIVGILLAALHWGRTPTWPFLAFCLANLVLVSGVLSVLYLHTRFIRRKTFLDSSFGLGDLLFLYAFALGFPTVTFLVLFCASICFSMLAHVVLSRFADGATVPLAGFMGIFLGTIFLCNLFSERFPLYLT